jgi:hypothetical protein
MAEAKLEQKDHAIATLEQRLLTNASSVSPMITGIPPPPPPPPPHSTGRTAPPPPAAPPLLAGTLSAPPPPPIISPNQFRQPKTGTIGAPVDLMAAIRSGAKLKKLDPENKQKDSSVPLGGQAALLAEIQSRPKLKNAVDRQLKAKPASPKKKGFGGMMGMMNIAQIAAQKAEARKKRVAADQ